MRFKDRLYIQLLTTALLAGGVWTDDVALCIDGVATPECNDNIPEWVQITSVVAGGCGPKTDCTDNEVAIIETELKQQCVNQSRCSFKIKDHSGVSDCAAVIDYNCIQGAKTTPQVPSTTPPREDDWVKDLGSWQWAIIWIIIAVVLVALIILIVMLLNRCCYKALNQDKPKFLETTPTHSNVGSTLNSRSVSMSTLHRAPPIKKEASQEEIDEVRAYFGTAKKNKDKNAKHFGVGVGNSTLDSRRSSGDGASGEPNGKLYQGDDSSSGIGSVTYDSRLKHGLYDDTDTCHDDYVSYTMKKQYKSPLVNPQTYNTLQNAKRVDEDLYKKEAPTVDICEDRREENFRMDINGWTLNKHGQQTPRADPAGASTVSADVEVSSDIQLNPDPHN